MNEYAQIIMIVAGAVAGVSVIWHQFVRPLFRSIKRGEQVWENVNTLDSFQKDVREFMVEMREHRDFVNHELNYNSGSSVKDMTRATKELIEQHVGNAELHRPFTVNVNNDSTNQN